MSKWSDWNEQKKIEANNRCSTCGILINWRRIPTGMCRKCSQKHAKGELASNWKGGRKKIQVVMLKYIAQSHITGEKR